MVNELLDEDKSITIKINKRLYHLITGLLVEKGLSFKHKIIEEGQE